MKVILRADVDGVGHKGDVVEVADGHGRNMLIPRGLALKATPGAERQAGAMRRTRELSDAQDRSAAEEMASRLVNHRITIAARAGEGGKLFGSVTTSDVARAIERIDRMLSVNKRWHLLSALRANRPILSLDDVDASGGTILDQLLSDNGEAESQDGKRVTQLNQAVGNLDPEDQLLVLLRFEHGMRAHEIAKVMQFENHRYVYTRLRTVINRLRREVILDNSE